MIKHREFSSENRKCPFRPLLRTTLSLSLLWQSDHDGAIAQRVVDEIFKMLDSQPEFSGSRHGCKWSVVDDSKSSTDLRYSLHLRNSEGLLIFSVNTKVNEQQYDPDCIISGFFVETQGRNPRLALISKSSVIASLKPLGYKFDSQQISSNANIVDCKFTSHLNVLIRVIAENFNNYH